jgi:formylglycine-generating enzyme required for sulfatase activity
VNEQIRKIQEYIYAKYVDPGPHGTLDEEAALRVLEEHYRHPENANDSECCYLGILYFELGFAFHDDARRADYFRRAKVWLERSGGLSHDSWDAVDDRLADIVGFFEDHGIPVEPPLPVTSAPGPISGTAVALAREIDDHGPMVLVPAGAFLFGGEREARSIAAFYVDKYPVTNRQYGAFCRATQYRWPKYWTDVRFNGPEQPVVGVSAADAAKYCKWVGKDLPTEEQWEKAARGQDGRAYPWGEDDPRDGLACFGRDPETGGTTPVASHAKGASPFGAMDLSGNAWEWTATSVEEGDTLQVVKGGCYSDPAEVIRADLRLEAGPKDKFENIGFRCVKSAG